jgi:hypothetical protein
MVTVHLLNPYRICDEEFPLTRLQFLKPGSVYTHP